MTCKYLKDFLTYVTVIQGKSKNTRKEYEYDLTIFLRYIKIIKHGLDVDLENIAEVDIDDIDLDFLQSISLEDIYEYLGYCQNIRQNGTKARARKVSSLRMFYQYLTKKKKYFKENPTEELETPKIGKRLPVYLNIDEIRKLYSGISKRHYYRDFCILTIFLNCGVRISELVSINLDSIRGNELYIIGKGNKQRTIYLNKSCMIALNDYLTLERPNIKNAGKEKALFLSQKGRRLSVRTIQNMIDTINKKSGLHKSQISPHKLRHTMATLLYQENGDLISLQQLLGHESVSTTQIYTHVSNDKLKQVVETNPLNSIDLSKPSIVNE